MSHAAFLLRKLSCITHKLLTELPNIHILKWCIYQIKYKNNMGFIITTGKAKSPPQKKNLARGSLNAHSFRHILPSDFLALYFSLMMQVPHPKKNKRYCANKSYAFSAIKICSNEMVVTTCTYCGEVQITIFPEIANVRCISTLNAYRTIRVLYAYMHVYLFALVDNIIVAVIWP